MAYEKPVFACAACAATIVMMVMTATPGFAQEPVTVTAQRPIDDQPTKIVKFGDLNLASAEGEKALLRRVGAAVREVCPMEAGGLREFQNQRGCRDFAWSGARPQIASALDRARLNPGLAAASLSISIKAR